MALEVPAERGIHAGSIQHGLLAVEVDELLQRERIPDDVTRNIFDGLLVLEGDRITDVRRQARMPPSQELPGEFLGDRVLLDQARQQALAEQLHDRVSVPGLERMKRSSVRERAVGREQVTMRMPLHEVAGAGDRDHDAGPRVRSELSLQLLGDGLRRALREVEKKLATLAEDSAEEARMVRTT